MTKRRRKMRTPPSARMRFERPAHRWTDDLDVIVGSLAILGGLGFIAFQAFYLQSIPNL